MKTLTGHEIKAVHGGGFFEDLGYAIGSFLGSGPYSQENLDNWQEYVNNNREELREAESSGLL